jgi:hypothetical protein
MRWRSGSHEDPGVDADLAAMGDWGPALRALREEPTPELLDRLDRRLQPDFARGRAEEGQFAAERPRRRLRLWPALAVGAPAAAAVVVAVVLIAGSGGEAGPGTLPVSVQSQPAPGAVGGTAAPEGNNALSRPGGPAAPAVKLASRQVAAGAPFVLSYTAPRAGTVFVSLSPLDGGSATTTRRVALPAGTGRLRIATDALLGGRYALVVSLPSGQSTLRSTVRVLD